MVLLNDDRDWHHVVVNQCKEPHIRAELKAVYREGLKMYHRHIEQMLDYQAQIEAGLHWPLDIKHSHTDTV